MVSIVKTGYLPLFMGANYLKLFTVSAEGIETTIFGIWEQSQSAKVEKLQVINTVITHESSTVVYKTSTMYFETEDETRHIYIYVHV